MSHAERPRSFGSCAEDRCRVRAAESLRGLAALSVGQPEQVAALVADAPRPYPARGAARNRTPRILRNVRLRARAEATAGALQKRSETLFRAPLRATSPGSSAVPGRMAAPSGATWSWPDSSIVLGCPYRGERDPSEVMQGHFRHLGRVCASRAPATRGTREPRGCARPAATPRKREWPRRFRAGARASTRLTPFAARP